MNFLGKLPTLFLNRFSDDDMEDLTGKTVIVTGELFIGSLLKSRALKLLA